ncbi:hypothetical protein [Dactylosporangium sp. NPDC000521]|uniref:hypothetical protein n=1 Tax=Dactylosporangium sp. NPDC000521 TaxID=3363975 RepID=UPI00367FDE2A
MVRLRFEGHRDAAGPLTAGQRNIAKWLLDAPHAPAAVLAQPFDVPPGATVADVAECFEVLLCRHEGLRSTYRLGDPGSQRVLAAGSLPLLRSDTPDLVGLLRAAPFDLAAGLTASGSRTAPTAAGSCGTRLPGRSFRVEAEPFDVVGIRVGAEAEADLPFLGDHVADVAVDVGAAVADLPRDAFRSSHIG